MMRFRFPGDPTHLLIITALGEKDQQFIQQLIFEMNIKLEFSLSF